VSRRGADEPAAGLDAAVASRTTSAPTFGAAAARLERTRAMLRKRLGPDAYAMAVARGRALTDDEVPLARDAIARTAVQSPVL
jgi:hypothetical protein